MKKLVITDLKNVHGYQPRKERVKQGNFECWITENGFIESTSYRWWKIVTEKNGLYFFNWYGYSNSTRKHQNEMSRIMRNLGLDYITVSYSGNLAHVDIDKILQDKIDSLYTGENVTSLKRQGAYCSYTESDFDQTMKDIKTIAELMKLKQSVLDKMLIAAEHKANEELFHTLADKHERSTLRRQLQKQNENLEAIAI